MSEPVLCSPFAPPLPDQPGELCRWGQLYGNSPALVISNAARQHNGPLTVVTADTAAAQRLEYALRFYLADTDLPILNFPDWETDRKSTRLNSSH